MRSPFAWLISNISDRLKQLNGTQEQLSNYASVIGWIIQDALRQFWARIVVILILDLVGIVSAAGAFGSVIAYVRQLTSEQAFLTIASITIDLRQPLVLAGFALLATAFGLLSAGTQYLAYFYIARVVVCYRQVCVARLMDIAADTTHSHWPKFIPGQPIRIIQRCFLTLLITCYTLRRLLLSFGALCTFIFALGCLFWFSVPLTLMLVPICAVYLAFVYHHNQHAMNLEKTSLPVNRKVRNVIFQSLFTALSERETIDEQQPDTDQTLSSDEYAESSHILRTRLTLIGQVRFANNVFFITCIVGLFSFFALTTTDKSRVWSDLLLYLFALRFAFGGLQRISISATQIIRTFPWYSTYVNFVRAAEQYHYYSDHVDLPPLPQTSFWIQSIESPLTSTPERIEVEEQALIWVILPYRPIYGDLQTTALRIENSLSPIGALVKETDFIEPASESATSDNSEPDDLQAKTNLELNNKTESQKQSASLMTTTSQGTAFIDVSVIFQGDRETIQAHLDRYQRIFLVTHDPERLLKARGICNIIRKRTTGVVILNDLNVVAGGSLYWLMDNLDSVRSYLDEQQAIASAEWGDGEGLDDDEMGF
jgi:hypothetical protein